MGATTVAHVAWPNVVAVKSLDYTASVGITPGVALLRTFPLDYSSPGPGQFGRLAWSDGNAAVELRDCLLEDFEEVYDDGGRVWNLRILDRRWMWEYGYAVSGSYNQLDARGKLVPWTVRSPYQLAVLLLSAMGETGFAIDLPAGLASAGLPARQVADTLIDPAQDYLNLGQNLPQTSTNLPADWNAVPAAQALAELAEQYGRIVVWDPISDVVSVQQPGTGTGLPIGAFASEAAAVNFGNIPAAITVVGSPTEYQLRVRCRPVGKDWDGAYYPLGELSYAPVQVPGPPTLADPAPAGGPVRMVVGVMSVGSTAATPNVVVNGAGFSGTLAEMAAAITLAGAGVSGSADPRVAGVAADVAGGYLYVIGPADGSMVWVTGDIVHKCFCLQGPARAGNGFAYSPVPQFPDVVPTARLNYPQAVQAAQQTVWRHYQVLNQDPADPKDFAIPVPGLGKVTNRFQLALMNSRVEPIEPRPPDVARIDPQTNQPFAAEFYNGYFENRLIGTYGSHSLQVSRPFLWARPDEIQMKNTPRNLPFYVPCRLADAERQVFAFDRPVYMDLGGERSDIDGTALPTAFLFPGTILANGTDFSMRPIDARPSYAPTDLVVEVGATVRDAKTFAPVRFSYTVTLAGAFGPARTVVRPDVKLEVIGQYDGDHKLTGHTLLDADPIARAQQYAALIAATYELTVGQTNTYYNVVPIQLTGFTRQVSWSLSRAGWVTRGSTNSEHSKVVLPYPARRRRERLNPDVQQVLSNFATINGPLAPKARGAD